jgi:hypothetical protein
MAPAAIVELIESLAPEDQMKVLEYAQLLRSKEYFVDWEETDVKYLEYILQGIREGEEAVARGDVYDVEEGRKRLEELLSK